jgi:hypothetical protein
MRPKIGFETTAIQQALRLSMKFCIKQSTEPLEAGALNKARLWRCMRSVQRPRFREFGAVPGTPMQVVVPSVSMADALQ